jgi:hypothetical protein
VHFQRDKQQSAKPTINEIAAIDMQIAALSLAIEGSASPGVMNFFACKDAIKRINSISRSGPIRDDELRLSTRESERDYVRQSAQLMRV